MTDELLDLDFAFPVKLIKILEGVGGTKDEYSEVISMFTKDRQDFDDSVFAALAAEMNRMIENEERNTSKLLDVVTGVSSVLEWVDDNPIKLRGLFLSNPNSYAAEVASRVIGNSFDRTLTKIKTSSPIN